MPIESPIFLGFDLSTQQIKVVAIDINLKPLQCYSVSFDEDFSKYKTEKGVYRFENNTIIAPVAMWLEAIDLVLDKMKQDEFPFDLVGGISGSCQQHGSVYWSNESVESLNQLNDYEATKDKNLKDILSPKAFSYDYSPNWQDHSTIEECKTYTEKMGSHFAIAKITGSKAYHRFTGPQIMKFIKKYPEKYAETKRITLVSNFLSSVLLGKFSKIDQADACGMNLYDIPNKKWSKKLLKIVVNSEKEKDIGELVEKLGGEDVELSGHQSLGEICDYFVSKYGFNNNCQIYSITGDNLATILSLPLLKNDLLISLGTSTTMLLITEKYKPNENYHVMIHPTNPDLYMNMICYLNGALIRDEVRDKINVKYNANIDNMLDSSERTNQSWQKFNEILESDEFEACFAGKIGVYFPQGEIIPNVDKKTILKYEFNTENGELLEKIDGDYEEYETNVKGCVESQALSCRIRVHELLKDETKEELKDLKPNSLIFVGGSSKNHSIITKFSEILGSEEQQANGGGNYRSLEPNSCALGGAFKAQWSHVQSAITRRKKDHENQDASEEFETYLKKRFNDAENLQAFKVDDAWARYKIAEIALRKLENVL